MDWLEARFNSGTFNCNVCATPLLQGGFTGNFYGNFSGLVSGEGIFARLRLYDQNHKQERFFMNRCSAVVVDCIAPTEPKPLAKCSGLP
jgi:hypothetical protein